MRISDWSSDVCSSDLRAFIRAAVSTRMHEHSARRPSPSSARPADSAKTDAQARIICSETLFAGAEVVVVQNRGESYRLRRSAESLVGKECVCTCKSRCSPHHKKKYIPNQIQ